MSPPRLMSVFEADQPPVSAAELVNWLDDDIEQPIIRSTRDLDPFEAGRRVGQRELVDKLVHVYSRESEDT